MAKSDRRRVRVVPHNQLPTRDDAKAGRREQRSPLLTRSQSQRLSRTRKPSSHDSCQSEYAGRDNQLEDRQLQTAASAPAELLCKYPAVKTEESNCLPEQVTDAEESPSAPPIEDSLCGRTPLRQIAAAIRARELGKSPTEQILAAKHSRRGITYSSLSKPILAGSSIWKLVGALIVIIAVFLGGEYVGTARFAARVFNPEFFSPLNLTSMPSFGVADHMPDLFTDLKLATLVSQALPGLGDNISTVGEHLSRWSASLTTTLAGSPAAMRSIMAPFSHQRPGLDLRQAGLNPKHPVLIIPGFVTSGLELWAAEACASHQLRQRIWGTWAMTYSFLLNKACWLKHMALDEATGLDPSGIKVRASKGLAAVDYFLPGYHVWAYIIEALSDFGYDLNNMAVETYDWRLSLPNLQKRDKYFTRVQKRIELLAEMHDEKVFVVSHSWGDTVFRCFLSWISVKDPDWVERYVAVYTNIAGPTLGVPKAVSSFLSGETRDTVEMGYMANIMANFHFTRAERTKLFRTWGGGIGMLPTGGTEVWGNKTWAPDDPPKLTEASSSYGSMLTMWEATDAHAEAAKLHGASLTATFSFGFSKPQHGSNPNIVNLDVESSLEVLLNVSGHNFKSNAAKWGAINQHPQECRVSNDSSDFHYSPLDCPLPSAPSLKMFCIYGVGVPTERAYQYEHFQTAKAFEAAKEGASSDMDPSPLDIPFKLNIDVSDTRTNLDLGVRISDGDGTVPLISLGTMCRKHWQQPELNPHNISVITREYKHELSWEKNSTATAAFNYMNPLHQYEKFRRFKRVYPRSCDHLDVLSNEGVLLDLLHIASGRADLLQDQIVSEIDSIASKVTYNSRQAL